jgi:hypothetical protein
MGAGADGMLHVNRLLWDRPNWRVLRIPTLSRKERGLGWATRRRFTKELFLWRVGLIKVHQEFDSVEVESAVANRPAYSNAFCASPGKKFDLDLRAHGQIRNGKQAHSDVAEIDTEGIDVTRSAENAHRSIQQLALATAAVWPGVESEGHRLHE